MQKRPKYPYSYCAASLDEALPFVVSGLFEQCDRTITGLHFHNAHELGICLEGTGIFVVEGKTLLFKGGDIIFIDRTERHLARSSTGTVSKWRWIHFDLPRALPLGVFDPAIANLSSFRGPEFVNVMSPVEQPRLCAVANGLLDEALTSHPFRKEGLISLLALFSIELHRAFPDLASGGGACVVEPEEDGMRRLGKAVETIAANYKAGVDMAALAAACGLSRTHFRRLFRKTFGKSPQGYLNQLRIAVAMSELAGSRKPIGEVAVRCGFGTLSSFNRMFKTHNGCSPREWRRRHKPNFRS